MEIRYERLNRSNFDEHSLDSFSADDSAGDVAAYERGIKASAEGICGVVVGRGMPRNSEGYNAAHGGRPERVRCVCRRGACRICHGIAQYFRKEREIRRACVLSGVGAVQTSRNRTAAVQSREGRGKEDRRGEAVHIGVLGKGDAGGVQSPRMHSRGGDKRAACRGRTVRYPA